MDSRTQVVWHEHQVTRAHRETLMGHAGCVIWFTGLSGCGKSTIANAVDRILHQRGIHTCLLDGDNIRHGLNASSERLVAEHGEAFAQRFGLGFGALDREENIRRIAAVAQLFCSAGLVTLTAFVSPYRRDRDAARRLVQASGSEKDFIEIYVNAPLEVCEQRDPKGLYRQARAGKLRNFTGIDDPYEPPLHPELELASSSESVTSLATRVVDYLASSGHIPVTPAR
jgi:adenylylsulfate kinase